MLVTSAREKLATDLGPLMKEAIPLSHTAPMLPPQLCLKQEKAVEITRKKRRDLTDQICYLKRQQR